MAFRHLLRSAVITPLFTGLQRISVQNLIFTGQTVPEKFELYMKMGHIWANLYIYKIDKYTNTHDTTYKNSSNQNALPIAEV